jgi:hypothetical protein
MDVEVDVAVDVAKVVVVEVVAEVDVLVGGTVGEELEVVVFTVVVLCSLIGASVKARDVVASVAAARDSLTDSDTAAL